MAQNFCPLMLHCGHGSPRFVVAAQLALRFPTLAMPSVIAKRAGVFSGVSFARFPVLLSNFGFERVFLALALIFST